MKRALLPIVLFVVVAVVVALVWLGKGSGSDDTAQRNDTARRDSVEQGTTGPASTLERSELDAPLSPADARAAAERAAASPVATRGPALDGQILAPPDCGADDAVEAFALAREADVDTLLSAIGPNAAGEDSTNSLESTRLVMARAKLEPSGRFHLELPAGTRKAHVLFAGRSWFLRDSFAVDVSHGASIVLQAECGGWIAGRIDLPSALVGRARELDGAVAVLRPALSGFGQGQRGFRRVERRALVAGTTFELRALDPASAYSIEVVPATFSASQVEVPEVARGRATPVTLPIGAGGLVSGRTLGADGQPVAGARVEARVQGQFFGFDDRLVRSTESATDGTFKLAAVAAGPVVVSASSKDHVSSDPKKLDVAEGASSSGLDLVLGAGETIAGVVTWKDGRPAAGATVTATSERGSRNFGPQAMRGPRRDGEPMATADEQGRFVLRGLSGSSCTANAEALTPEDAAASATSSPAVRSGLAWRARAAGVKAGATDVALMLEPPLVVRGKVLSDSDGAPVKRFSVRAQIDQRAGGGPGGGGPGGGFDPQRNASRNGKDFEDEKGEFVLGGLREGAWSLDVTAEGFAPADAVAITLPKKETDTDLVFRLKPAAVVTGTVTSPAGAPVPGANVTQASGSAAPGWMRGAGNDTAESAHARTDANGRFRIDGLKAGRIALVAESKDWAKSSETKVELVAGATTADVALVMHQGGRITGELYDEGRAGAGRTVNATHSSSFTNVSARTDGRGHFVFEHAEAGSWRLIVVPSPAEIAQAGNGGNEGGMGSMLSRLKTTNVDVVDGQEVHVVMGAPPEDPVNVRGKVTQGGAGVAGVRVIFMQQGKAPGQGTKTAQSSDDGSYTLQVDAPGAYSVAVSLPQNRLGMIEFDAMVKAGAEAVIDLPLPTARISGKVRTPAGDPAPRVRVTLLTDAQAVGGSLAGGFNDLNTDDQGAFDLPALRAGNYALAIGGSRALRPGPPSETPYGRKVVSGIHLKEGEWRQDIDVRLEMAGSVQVEVVDHDGDGVSGAAVFARDASGRAVERLTGVRTDANGKSTYVGLAPGRYTFSAHKDLLASGESPAVDVTEGGTSSTRVSLAPGSMLVVTTQDEAGAPVRAQVAVTDEGGRDVAGLLSYQELGERFQRGGLGGNEQRIGPLAPGQYRVRGTAPDGRTVEKSVTLGPEGESRMTLAFGT